MDDWIILKLLDVMIDFPPLQSCVHSLSHKWSNRQCRCMT